MLKRHLFFMAILGAVLALGSCAKKGDGIVAYNTATVESGAATPRMAAMSKKAVVSDMAMAVEESADFDDTESANGTAQGEYERKLIKNGSISVEVQNLSETELAVENWIKQFNGYVSFSNHTERNANFTVKVPAANFDAAMEAAGNLGSVKNRSVSTQDVSEQYYDLQTRLETRKVLRDKLNGYLSRAANMTDMLKIEKELNSVQTEIESMEGRLKRLSSQIDFSTINVNIYLPYATTEQGFEFPSLSTGLRKFFVNLIGFYGAYIAAIFYFIICGIGVIAALAFFYWLLLGRIGLLRKLFALIKKNQD